MENVPPREHRETAILAMPQSALAGFVGFLRERGVAAFAFGVIFGGAAQKLVQALMDDIINPALGLIIGRINSLSDYSIGAFKIGDFISVFVNFLILLLVIYILFKILQLERLDKPKDK
jgi:large conductance mechanosensitive channel